MSKRTLEQAFNAVFHNKYSYDDFCSSDISSEVTEIILNDRTVFKTSEKLKKYLRFTDKVILRHIAKHSDVVHSYVREKSVLSAVKAHAFNKVFFVADIQSFFPNIGESDVERILLRDAHLIPIKDFESHISHLSKLTTWKGTLPIGFPTSPQLSNSFLFEFDNALHAFCKENNLTYTRYSDDIIISGNEKDELVQLRDTVKNLLQTHASEKMNLNAKKTRLTHLGNKVKILGLILTGDGRVTIDSSHKRKLETLMYFYSTDKIKYEDFLNKMFVGPKKDQSLFGLLHYVKATDPAYLLKLQKKYGLLTLRKLMEDKWSGH